MKKLILLAAILPAMAAQAQWQGSQQQYGNTTYGNYSGPNGQSMNSTSQQYGNTAYTNQTYNDAQGHTSTRNCTSQRYGNQVYTNCY
ncbi:hypothetical protein B0G81_6492 [Paraburkholderia sp. BL6665CI2N2]|uniref:hypothetical protein n=1 Tax=Paraburkholderia sp. BL6665CI2N2 TaxID=1938806 RepID=UPI00106615CF|nr:hypothetical protein [Paraburkholderia sp. BL6665CI2N2]TDY25994.1 hypothetical protein B0G81_6492 [Paraburkholderia sp. BL6665CI2N2]